MSDGLTVIRGLLIADAAMVGLVPPERIGAGLMPQGTPLPWLSLSLVSSTDRNTVAAGAVRHVVDRVQVTVAAATYDAVGPALKAVQAACADQFPDVNGLSDVVVLGQGRGPDFMDNAASIYLGSRDFMISYNEVRA
jgi:Protein of unknown function (DUF3168)